MKDFLRTRYPRLYERLANTDLVVLMCVLVVVGAIWTYIEIAGAVSGGSTQQIDERIIMALRNPRHPEDPIGPKFMEEICRDLTALGGVAVLAIMTCAVATYLWMRGMVHAMSLLLAATIGGLIISSLLKHSFDRPRPDLVPHLSAVYTSSFPSGHSMLSAVVYLTLGTLLARFVEQRRLKVYFITLALLLTGLVGFSRVYLGVHYPTDVLAGWMAGLSWAILCWLAARFLQRRGAVEQMDQS